jgi:methionyl-tRNA synthetase
MTEWNWLNVMTTENKFFITTPIYYVNDVPHIGHAYTTLASDVLARWHRGHGREVLFVTGTDEHGTKIAQAAAAHNKPPQQYCDEIAEQFKETWKTLNITHDSFIRTTDLPHQQCVVEFMKRLWQKGVIYQGRYQGKYCVQCERFYADDELIGGLCPDHRIPPETQSEDNYFFRLSHFREEILRAITDEEHPQHFKIFPRERRNEVIGKLKQEVNDVSISRATLAWGIPLPWDRSQTTYVWVDALLNYLTAAGFPNEPRRVEEWWPADLHLMAKDILWFHAIIWPALLMAAELPLPKTVFAHGFFTVNGQKMSKSLGNVIRPAELVREFGVDGTRYLLLSAFPFGSDGDFTMDTMKTAYNAALANDLGNLISRALTMAEKYCDSKVPAGSERSLVELVLKDLAPMDKQLDHLQFKDALATIFIAVDRVNRFIEDQAPWKLAKNDPTKVGPTLRQVLVCLKVFSFYLRPFLPDTAQNLWMQLGQPDYIKSRALEFFDDPQSVDLATGQTIRRGAPYFPRK